MYKITDLMFSLNISTLSRHSNPLQNNGIVYFFAFILTCDSRIYIKHDKKNLNDRMIKRHKMFIQ